MAVTLADSKIMPIQMKHTLIGIVFVILLVVGVIGLFTTCVFTARSSARRMACGNNLKQIGLALHAYHEAFNRLPCNGLYFTTDESNNSFVGSRSSRGSVLLRLVPYTEASPYYNLLNFDVAGEPWGFERQIVTAVESPGVKSMDLGPMAAHNYVVYSYLCPSARLDPFLNRGTTEPAISCYAPSMGAQRMPSPGDSCLDYPGNVFNTGSAPYGLTSDGRDVSGLFARGHWAARFSDITKAQASVIAFGEILPNKSQYQSRGWVRADALSASTTAPINFPIRGIGERGFPGPSDCRHYANRQTSDGFKSRHRNGAQFVMADGSTQFLSEDIDYMVYQSMGERRDQRSGLNE